MTAPDARDLRRLQDIDGSITTIGSHLTHGDLSNVTVLDAVLYRLVVIGEAAKTLSQATTDAAPHIPWRTIARARDHFVHRYFATVAEVVQDTVTNDLPLLAEAVASLLDEAAAAAEGPGGGSDTEHDPTPGGV